MQQTKPASRTTPFSATCIRIMDLFLQHPDVYFTPKTASLSIDLSQDNVKNCMSILLRNSYLSKVDDGGHTYHITKENMEFWVTDFRKHVLNLETLRRQLN